jgi:hypothetical protein
MGSVKPGGEKEDPLTIQIEQSIEAEKIIAGADTQQLPQVMVGNKPPEPTKQADSNGKEQFNKNEFDLVRDVIANVNSILRLNICLSVALIAACITVFDIMPSKNHGEFIFGQDKYVFILGIISVIVAFIGLERYPVYSEGGPVALDMSMLNWLVKYKYRMLRIAQLSQGLALMLFAFFVLLEYR